MNGKISAKSVVLLAVVALLAILVLRDRTSAGAETETPASPRQSYIDANTVTRSVEALIARRDQWDAANKQARRAWADSKTALIQAPSVNIAESSLRSILEEAMRDVDLTLSVSSPTPRQTPIEGEPLHVIGLTINFDAPNPGAVYTLLDRIENATAPRMVITDLEIRGPGKAGRPGLHVKMDVASMSWIGGADD